MRLPKQLKYSIIGFALSIASGALSAQTDNLAEAHRLLKQGQPAQALSRADAYAVSKPHDPQGRFVRGLALAEMNRTSEAIAVFKKLTEDFPELPEPYNNLAVLYAQEKQFEKARNALEAAIRTHPSYAVAHENLGDIYAKLASQAYGKALQTDAGGANPQSNKLALLRDLNARPAGKPVELAKAGGEPAKLAVLQPGNRLGTQHTPLVVAPQAAPAAAVVQTPTAAAKQPAPPLAAAAPEIRQPAKPAVAVNSPVPAALPPSAASPTPPVVAAAPSAPVSAAPTAKPANGTSGSEPELAKTLDDWAAAWARKDVKAYLAHYSPDFQTPNGQARRAWEIERSQRIGKPGKIEVGTEQVVVALAGTDKATVRFRQHYKSANLSTSATKTLVFVRLGGRWLIQQERVN
jgi:tetratricopeptide (TPR) repeat protein